MQLAPGTLVAGRYRVGALLGAGTMGTVHRAERLDDGAPVALKRLHRDALGQTELRRRFEREAKALATAAHPNVLVVIEHGEDQNGVFLVTELLEGRSLETMLAEQRLAPTLAIAIIDQALAGLGHAHGLGILHRDVKPGNVFLAGLADGSMRVKLLDFGLAKFHDKQAWGEQSLLTQDGAILGTPAYMAPEQVFGPGVDARTDVYAAGVLMFELLTGTWPFVAEDNAELLRAHALQAPPTLADTRPELTFRPELEALVARALAKRPRERFENATVMRAALGRIPRPAAW